MGVSSKRSSFERSRHVYPIDSMEPGIGIACRLVSSVIGPCGRSVLVGRGPAFPLRSQSGYSVLQQVELAHRPENAGLSFMRELAWRMKSDHQDGTSSVVLIAAQLLRNAGAAVAAGITALELAEALQVHGGRIVEQLISARQAGDDLEALYTVAAQVAGDETRIGRQLAEIAADLGPDGCIEIEESGAREDKIVVEAGYGIEGGWASARLAGADRNAIRLDDPLIVIHPDPIDSFDAIEPVMRMAASAGRSLLFLTDGISGQALATLVVNHQAGKLRAMAAKLGASGDARWQMLDDLSAGTGAAIIGERSGTRLADLRPRMVGRADHALVAADRTLIYGGKGDPEAITARIAGLRAELQQPESLELNRQRALRRLAYLTSGVARARLAASSGLEINARMERARSIVAALSSARKGGVIGGGASAFIAAEMRARRNLPSGAVGAAVGRIFAEALSAPLRCIVSSAGVNADWVVERVREDSAKNICFDVVSQTFVDSRTLSDPLDVVAAAVARAVSATSVLLAANKLIVREAP